MWHQTTNLGVRSSNLSGRARLRDIPCESHGIHTVETGCAAVRSDSTLGTDAAGRGYNLAKVGVEGSNPFARSSIFTDLSRLARRCGGGLAST
jgi:hypothetical protein